MSQQTILIIRHAEKPVDGFDGVDVHGKPDPESLIPLGWQRAGAWVQFFQPAVGTPSLPQPDKIFAAAHVDRHDAEKSKVGSKSRRPVETVTPLAQKLSLTVDTDFTKGQETALAAAISSAATNVLVCWQHEGILEIVAALSPVTSKVPSHWPGDRFNVVFRLDRADQSSPWNFSQICPVLLSGDSSEQIAS